MIRHSNHVMQIVEVFFRFLLLGCISFGGPAAHFGYFNTTFVERLKWMSQEQFANTLALCQFLPGPGSSQLGFAIGLHRAGYLGAVAAFIGFTLPSFILMLLLASATTISSIADQFAPIINGLKLFAVVIVADAIITMFKAFCRQWQSVLIAFGCSLILILIPSFYSQIAALIVAALTGTSLSPYWKHNQTTSEQHLNINWLSLSIALALFLLLLIAFPLLSNGAAELLIFSEFYSAGSLVFGGGHVVLPLLQHTAGATLSSEQFLTGYAAAQAVPGPMFTIATYLGSLLHPNQLIGASIATIAIFLPGMLLLLTLKDGWQHALANQRVAGAVAGINAAVVGLLTAAFYNPVIANAIDHWLSAAVCLLGLLILRTTKPPILVMLFIFVGMGYVI